MEYLNNAQSIINYQSNTFRNRWIMLHILFLIVLFLVFLFYPLETHIDYIGYYKDNLIHINVAENFFQIETKEVEIQGEKYHYEIKEIKPALYEDGSTKIWEVTIHLDLKDEWKIENYTFRLSFLKEKNTLISRFIKKIKKGMRL